MRTRRRPFDRLRAMAGRLPFESLTALSPSEGMVEGRNERQRQTPFLMDSFGRKGL